MTANLMPGWHVHTYAKLTQNARAKANMESSIYPYTFSFLSFPFNVPHSNRINANSHAGRNSTRRNSTQK